jgi:conjugative transposon TraM protein
MKNLLKKNKALFLLPLAAIPFLALIFHSLGGGKGEVQEKSHDTEAVQGANYSIPEAEKSIEIFDKMEAYQQQANFRDELTQSTWDPDSSNNIVQVHKDSTAVELSDLAQQNHQLPENLLAHIKQKEQELRKELAEPEQQPERKTVSKRRQSSYTAKVEKQTVQPSTGIEELEKVFDENIELNRQNDSLKFDLQQSKKRLAKLEQNQSILFSLDKRQASGFTGKEARGALIKAEIYETTTVLNGNRVKLRLLEDTWLNEKKVPRNTFIYGICNIKNERLHIEISQMPTGKYFLPVKLAIHDLDGLPGLYVPDNVARKVTQEVGASTNTSSMLGVTNNPLTYAGIRAADRTAQTLLKRVRLKKVTVKKNTLVYLINQQSIAGM